MRIQLRSSLALSEVERVAERFLDQQHLPITALKTILEAGFLDLDQGRCAFRHELLQRYFEALDLMHSNPDIACLIAELRKPAHHTLIEFVLGLEPDSQKFLSVLRSTAGFYSTSGLFSDCLQGRFGASIRVAVEQDVKKLFQTAQEDLNKLSVVVETAELNGHRRLSVKLGGLRDSSPYESAVWNTIAKQLSRGCYLDESLHLVGESERVVTARLAEKLGETAVREATIRSKMFSDVFVLGLQEVQLPAHTLIREAEWNWTNQDTSAATLKLAERCDCESQTSYTALYLLLRIVTERNAVIEGRLAALLQRCWDSGIYHLRLEVLNFVRRWSHEQDESSSLSQGNRQAIEGVLSSFDTNDIMLNTQLIEVKSVFNLIELGITVDDVRSEILETIKRPDDPTAQESAARVISNIFEDVFQGIYFEAIDELDKEQRDRLFSMAALAVPDFSMSAAFILEHLVKNPTAEAASAFERFSKELDGESFLPQEVTRCFLLAHQGAAIVRATPWTLTDVEADDRRAWQCYGEIIFWLSKKGLTPDEVNQKCTPLWSTLSGELSSAAIDPLMRFVNSISSFGQQEDEHPVWRLFNEFRFQIRQLLESGLAKRERLTSIDSRMNGSMVRREQTTFIVHMLGQIGDLATVSLLSPFTNDREFGEVAVESIRCLQAGRGFETLKIRRRLY